MGHVFEVFMQIQIQINEHNNIKGHKIKELIRLLEMAKEVHIEDDLDSQGIHFICIDLELTREERAKK